MVCEIVGLGEGLTTDATGKPLAVGDRFVAPYLWTCRQCHACAHGEYYYTTRRQPLYKVPEDLPNEAVAPLNCALAQVLFALRDVRLGNTVVIQGAGGLGSNANQPMPGWCQEGL